MTNHSAIKIDSKINLDIKSALRGILLEIPKKLLSDVTFLARKLAKLAEKLLNWPKNGQKWPKLAKKCPKLVQNGRNLAKIGSKNMN